MADSLFVRYASIRALAAVAALAASAVFIPAASADGIYWQSPAQDNTYYDDLDDIPSMGWSIVGNIVYADCAFERVTPSPVNYATPDCGFTPSPGMPDVDLSMAPASFGLSWDVGGMVSMDGTYRLYGDAGFTAIEPASFSRTFTLDSVDPLVAVTGPLGWTNDPTPDVGFSITDANPGTTKCGYDATGPSDPALGVCASSPPSLPALADGTHTFWAVHTDLAGNVASASKTFDVDATAPSISITGVAQGQVLEQAMMGVSVEASDAGAGLSALSCAWDGGALGSCTSTDFTSAILADGSHTLTAVASDQLGNTNTQTIAFSVDTTAGIKQGLIAPKTGTFKIKRGALKRGKYAATMTTMFSTPAGGDAKSCSGTAATRVLLKKKQLGSAKVKFKAAGAKCTATSALKLSKKYKGKKLTLVLDYKNGPIKAFRITSRSLKF